MDLDDDLAEELSYLDFEDTTTGVVGDDDDWWDVLGDAYQAVYEMFGVFSDPDDDRWPGSVLHSTMQRWVIRSVQLGATAHTVVEALQFALSQRGVAETLHRDWTHATPAPAPGRSPRLGRWARLPKRECVGPDVVAKVTHALNAHSKPAAASTPADSPPDDGPTGTPNSEMGALFH